MADKEKNDTSRNITIQDSVLAILVLLIIFAPAISVIFLPDSNLVDFLFRDSRFADPFGVKCCSVSDKLGNKKRK